MNYINNCIPLEQIQILMFFISLKKNSNLPNKCLKKLTKLHVKHYWILKKKLFRKIVYLFSYSILMLTNASDELKTYWVDRLQLKSSSHLIPICVLTQYYWLCVFPNCINSFSNAPVNTLTRAAWVMQYMYIWYFKQKCDWTHLTKQLVRRWRDIIPGPGGPATKI